VAAHLAAAVEEAADRIREESVRRVLIQKTSMEERSMYFYRMQYPSARTLLCCALALFVVVMFQGAALAAKSTQKTFGTRRRQWKPWSRLFGTTMKSSLSPFSDPAVRH